MSQYPEHGNHNFINNNEIGDNTHELYENIEELEKKTEESQMKTRDALVSISKNLITVFPYAAGFFVQQLTVNDRPDINFISLLMSYLLQLGVIIVLKAWIVSNEKNVKAIITSDFYDVVMDTFHFIMILYTIILIRLVSSYFNFTIDDTFTIIVIFVLINLFVRLFIRISSQVKYSME